MPIYVHTKAHPKVECVNLHLEIKKGEEERVLELVKKYPPVEDAYYPGSKDNGITVEIAKTKNEKQEEIQNDLLKYLYDNGVKQSIRRILQIPRTLFWW